MKFEVVGSVHARTKKVSVTADNPSVGLSVVAEHFPCGKADSVVVEGVDWEEEHDASNIAPITKINMRFRINPL
jgi:hypothetical protein